MTTRLDRMIARARAPLSELRPVVPSASSAEPPLRDDVQESGNDRGESRDERHRAPLPASRPAEPPLREDVPESGSNRGESRDERHRAPLSVLRPLAPSVFSEKPPLREDVHESGNVSAKSPDESASFQTGEAPALSRSEQEKTAHPVPRINGTPRIPGRMTPPPVRPGLLAENEAPLSLAERSPNGASKSSAPHDLPAVAAVSSPRTSESMPKSDLRESLVARGSSEFAPFPAYAKPAGPTPPRASSPRASSVQSAESLIEVNLSIGSIDFRSARPAVTKKRSAAHPRVTLENYLRRGKRDA